MGRNKQEKQELPKLKGVLQAITANPPRPDGSEDELDNPVVPTTEPYATTGEVELEGAIAETDASLSLKAAIDLNRDALDSTDAQALPVEDTPAFVPVIPRYATTPYIPGDTQVVSATEGYEVSNNNPYVTEATPDTLIQTESPLPATITDGAGITTVTSARGFTTPSRPADPGPTVWRGDAGNGSIGPGEDGKQEQTALSNALPLSAIFKFEPLDESEKQRLAGVLRKMKDASKMFYAFAQSAGNHAFIEFTGLMNEYIKVCESALEEGINFTAANVHSSVILPMKAHNMEYLAAKLGCIFAPAFRYDLELVEVFKTAFAKKIQEG